VHLRMFLFALVAALVTLACGGSSPTTPTSTYVAPIPSPNVVRDGGISYVSPCYKDIADIIGCFYDASIKNSGQGCATNTTVTLRYFSDGVQVGSTFPMKATNGDLRTIKIRPGETVSLRTVTRVPGRVIYREGERTYRLDISTDTVAC